ncbi:MAG: hypothetical protein ABFC98_02420 [Candidatus Cloacimonas sp.]
MKLHKVMLLLVLVAVIIMISACSSNKKTEATPQGKPQGEVVYRPTWWSSQPEKDFVCTYGQATKLSENASMDAARANALQEAAQYVEVLVNSMLKNYEEEAGVKDPQVLALTQNVVKAVSSAKFTGVVTGSIETRRVTEPEGMRYKTWIQLKIPKDEINKKLAESINNEEALYNQFKASQAFQELEKSVEKY